jgi:hypothetical protein
MIAEFLIIVEFTSHFYIPKRTTPQKGQEEKGMSRIFDVCKKEVEN